MNTYGVVDKESDGKLLATSIGLTMATEWDPTKNMFFWGTM